MPLQRDNPAARLQALLLELHTTHPHEQHRQRNTAWNAVCGLMDVQPESPAGLQAIADTVRLPEDVADAISAHVQDEEERDHLLESLPLARSAMTALASRQSLLQMIETFAPGGAVHMSGLVRDLASCSRVLQRAIPSSVLTDEELDRLRTLISELMEQVISTSLDADVRLLLITHLQKMLEAVQRVRLGGRAAIEEELDAVIGALTRRPESVAQLRSTGLLDKIAAWADALNGILSVGTGSAQLGQTVMRALE
ncbi:hypothetical protein [Streptomyces sp. NPDC059611]|uniref:hypothetical protein n=1 Tax=Streptomyces sp. NPDC059611 TaxID=3346884 RepID=UPI0036B463E1